MISATEAKARMLEIEKQLDAWDFGNTWVYASYEDGSRAMYRHAFAVTEDNWTYIFREHGSPEFIHTEAYECFAIMLRPVSSTEYSVDSINKRRQKNSKAPKIKRSFKAKR